MIILLPESLAVPLLVLLLPEIVEELMLDVIAAVDSDIFLFFNIFVRRSHTNIL